MADFKSSKKLGDFFSNAPDIVIDKILDKLPICNAALTSVLSKKWRRAWLSMKDLVFDIEFWKKLRNKDGNYDSQKCAKCIGDILLYHNGLVHYFYLLFPCDSSFHLINHGQWIAFLSKNGVRKIVMHNGYHKIDITSYIFSCSELVHLHLDDFNLNPPPADFSGFPNLKFLKLSGVGFVKQNFLCSLIENCRRLETLELVCCEGIDDIVIDAPRLQSLILFYSSSESLAFRNMCSLKSIAISLMGGLNKVDIVDCLASCRQLQSIDFDAHLCKLFVASSIIRSSPVTFNHVEELCLSDLNLSEAGCFRDVLFMIQCCSNIKKLDISVIEDENENGVEHVLDCNYNNKLDHLLEVNIDYITGSSAELKLIEYLLAASVVLEKLCFHYAELDIESEVKISRELMKFPRASSKASLLCTRT